jgi:flagellar biosynthetic protein FliR
MTTLVLAVRGAVAIALVVALVGGLPRLVQIGLAVTVGLWSAVVAGVAVPDDALWLVLGRELVIGCAIGVVAALPLLAAAMAGRLVDVASGARTRGPYGALFSLLAAAVFVGIDGHVACVAAIAGSFGEVPALASAEPGVVATLGAIVPIAVRLAIPWLITGAVVEIAAGAAMRLAGRAAVHTPISAATEAALVMMTATLIGTFAVAVAVLVR